MGWGRVFLGAQACWLVGEEKVGENGRFPLAASPFCRYNLGR